MLQIYLIAKKISLKKIINFLKVQVSKLIIRYLGRYCNFGKPWSVSIEPVNFCNLKCKACPSGKNQLLRKKDKMSLIDFKNHVDKIKDTTLNLFLYFQGEPFLNEDCIEMIKYANANKIFTCTSTNAQLIDKNLAQKIVESKLDKIIISLDGFDQESYQKYRVSGQFSKVIDAIDYINFYKKELKSLTPYLEIQCLITNYNEKNFDFFKSLKANKITFKTMQFSPENLLADYKEFAPKNPKFNRYKIIDNRVEIKKKIRFCSRILDSMVISVDGKRALCCYDKDCEHFNKLELIAKKKTSLLICQNCAG